MGALCSSPVVNDVRFGFYCYCAHRNAMLNVDIVFRQL